MIVKPRKQGGLGPQGTVEPWKKKIIVYSQSISNYVTLVSLIIRPVTRI